MSRCELIRDARRRQVLTQRFASRFERGTVEAAGVIRDRCPRACAHPSRRTPFAPAAGSARARSWSGIRAADQRSARPRRCPDRRRRVRDRTLPPSCQLAAIGRSLPTWTVHAAELAFRRRPSPSGGEPRHARPGPISDQISSSSRVLRTGHGPASPRRDHHESIRQQRERAGSAQRVEPSARAPAGSHTNPWRSSSSANSPAELVPSPCRRGDARPLGVTLHTRSSRPVGSNGTPRGRRRAPTPRRMMRSRGVDRESYRRGRRYRISGLDPRDRLLCGRAAVGDRSSSRPCRLPLPYESSGPSYTRSPYYPDMTCA